MQSVLQQVEAKFKKKQVVDVRSGDTVRVHQKIREGNKERVQVFQGLVIRTDRKDSLSSRITVRRVTGGIGVEKSFLLHSPLVVKVEVVKRSKVRRKNLSYMRQRTGKSARLSSVDFDKDATNIADEAEEEPKEQPENENATNEKPSTDNTETTEKSSDKPTDKKKPESDDKA